MASGDRLTGLDASFLHLEDGPAHMHVASTTVFEGPVPDIEELREHIASRLHLVPRFRQKLRFVPFGQGRPVWVDDPQFNLGYHVRNTALPEPGTEQQLRTLAARIFSQRLDRSKPLWEMWLAEGLDGDRFAIVTKSHHCLVDGISGVDITAVVFDTEADVPSPRREPWVAEPEPSDAQLLSRALVERAVTPAEAVRGVRAAFRRPRRFAGSLAEGLQSVGALAKAGVAAPDSPFNVDISPYRRFAWVRGDLAEFKRIKDTVGGTVNDVVLAAVAGGLGRFMRARGHATADVELKAMVPISLRPDEARGDLGNQVSAMYANLPVGIEDAAERLRAVSAGMGDLKESKQAVGASLLTDLADFAPPTILGQAGRLQSRQRFFNMVVTNVPGPQFPLYLMGRELEAIYPMVPLAKRQAVCFGIMSYNGQVNFGLTGDYEAMADIDSLAHDLSESLAALAELAPAKKRSRNGKPEGRKPLGGALQAEVSFEIRAAELGDAGSIVAIYNEAIVAGTATFRTEPRPVEDIEAMLGQGYPFLVAAESATVGGWASAGPYEESNPSYAGVAEVAVYVGSDARGRGVGSKLLDALDVAAEGVGKFKLVAKVFTTNSTSLRLFERAGYSKVGTHVRHGRLRGEWKDVVVLEKLIGEAVA